MSDQKYCTKCGTVGVPEIEEESRFSLGWGILLFLCGIIPGVIYWLAVGSPDRFYVCQHCNARSCLIPLDSPFARNVVAAK